MMSTQTQDQSADEVDAIKMHQELGQILRLFTFDIVSPGSAFFYPNGMKVRQKLIASLRRYYRQAGYLEVDTPNIYDKKLWLTSGHWEKYQENMFHLTKDQIENLKEVTDNNESDNLHQEGMSFSLKAMNCIAGDSIVSLADNTSIQINQLRNSSSNILGYDSENSGLRSVPQEMFLDQGEKKCVELLFSDSRKLICTPDHEIMTLNGWKKCKDLIENEDYVCVGTIPPLITGIFNNHWKLEFDSYCFTMENKSNYDKSLAFARFCGIVITDGSISKGRYGYEGEIYIGHEIDVEVIKKDLILITGKCDYRFREDRNLWCMRVTANMAGLIAHFFGSGNRMMSDMLLPEFIMDPELPPDFLRQFLSGVFGGDGWAPVLAGNSFTEVYLALSKSKEKLPILLTYFEQLVVLLNRAGIHNCIVTGPYKNQCGDKWHYRVKIPSSSLNDFAKYIGFAYNCHKAQRLTVVDSYYKLKNAIITQNENFKCKFKEIMNNNPEMKLTKIHDIVKNEFLEKDEYMFSQKYSIPDLKSIRSYLRDNNKLRNIGGKGFYSPRSYLEEIGALSYFTNKYSVPRGTILPVFKLKFVRKRLIDSKMKVYDITVDKAVHSFVANGIVVHNCPGHCVLFNKMNVSHKQLPLRLAEFGILHRNESSGSLRGLTRVRRFQQDDAHIFCTLEQISQEIGAFLQKVHTLYSSLDFDYQMEVSTRPEKYLGDSAVWDQAESILKAVVKDVTGQEPTINEGDGAFYGPKIDISIQDSLKRWHQCATVQLDFNLPERFQLTYTDWAESDNSETSPVQVHRQPIMVHRAILGSIERFLAIVLEHTQGHLPFWMSPTQVMVLPIKPSEHAEYARELYNEMLAHGYDVALNDSSDDLRQKIKEAELAKFNYILVIGGREVKDGTVAVRTLGKKKIQTMSKADFYQFLADEPNPISD